MPTYVYECSSCQDTFEIEQRITENALDTCRCGSQGTVKRLIQPTAVMFKGSGFHINDYASSGGSKPSEAKTEAKAECSGEPASCPSCSTN
ncbi:MAG TPA: FmdB family zinc ribbon protein [Fimbriimonas sp.]